jgi:hypothetical protein
MLAGTFDHVDVRSVDWQFVYQFLLKKNFVETFSYYIPTIVYVISFIFIALLIYLFRCYNYVS